MKRALFVTSVLLASIVAPTLAPSIGRADTLHTFAVGGGVVVCDPNTDLICTPGMTYEHFAFSAHLDLGSATAQPSGHVVLRDGSGPGMSNGQISFQGPVTCLKTGATPQGGVGIITFQVTKTNAQSAAPYMTFAVLDPGQGSSAPDQITPAGEAFAGPQDCQDVPLDPTMLLFQPATKGNIVVSLSSPMLGATLQGDWWYTDSSGNLYVWDPATNSWTLVQ